MTEPFELIWTDEALTTFQELQLEGTRSRGSKQLGRLKQVVKALRMIEQNPKHPGLHTHAMHNFSHPWSPHENVWQSYAQNRTPGAYRIFWCYGPKKGQITILTITPHP